MTKEINMFSVQPLPGGVMHSYVLPGAAWEVVPQIGTVVDSIPFTHPAHVPALLELLRHQSAINTLLRSCITSECAGTGRGHCNITKLVILGKVMMQSWQEKLRQFHEWVMWWVYSANRFGLWPSLRSPSRVWDQLFCDLPPTWHWLARCLWAEYYFYLISLGFISSAWNGLVHMSTLTTYNVPPPPGESRCAPLNIHSTASLCKHIASLMLRKLRWNCPWYSFSLSQFNM